ncbi:MAG: NTP transferase domain-containing protein [Dehalococcoidales bacterium]|nr:NTP transferase domain-containing protein [Dehalococcoidales bacterium]
MSSSDYAAIILAAGLSSRMDDFKPLMKIGGMTIADRVITLFRDSGINVILVTGWRQEELRAGIVRHDITVTENPLYETGMLSSVRAGVRMLQPGHRAFFMMPVDIPLVRPATIRRLLDFANDNPEKIIYPVFNGKHGHPPLIPALLAEEITGWSGDGGLNTILNNHRDIQVEFGVADENVLADADYKDDFSRLVNRYETVHIPSEAECTAVLDIAGTPENVRRHCRVVAKLAVNWAEALYRTGYGVNVDEVHAAAVLHDIAKGIPYHGREGARMLTEHGFGRIGDIISIHQDLVDETDSADMETKLVYLADKMVIGEELVSVEKRYNEAFEKYGDTPEVAEKIRIRNGRALRVKAEVEDILGYGLETILEG